MAVSNPDQLKAEIDELVPDLVAMRRDLHEHPELSFEEVRTSGIVAQRLRSLGLDVRTGVAKTGVVGLLHGGASKPGAKKKPPHNIWMRGQLIVQANLLRLVTQPPCGVRRFLCAVDALF